MVPYLAKKKFIICLILSFLFTLPLFFKSKTNPLPKPGITEKYNADLASINSLQMAQEYIDKEYNKLNNTTFDTLAYVKLTTRFTKERFYHGISYYSFTDNWILYLGGKIFWEHLFAIVDPDDILKHSEALCSQQTIVYMELLKRKKINVRSIGLGYIEGPGHFLAEVNYANKWHLYDVTLEPEWKKVTIHHESLDFYLKNLDSLYLAYESVLPRPIFNKILEKVSYGEPNQFPARKMLFVHRFAKYMTYLIPAFFLLLSLYFYKKKNNEALKQNYSFLEADLVEA